jgi:hypothetical protein
MRDVTCVGLFLILISIVLIILFLIVIRVLLLVRNCSRASYCQSWLQYDRGLNELQTTFDGTL